MKSSQKQSKLYLWQQKTKEGGVCAKCGETRHLTVDHIVPQFLLEQFTATKELGYEMEENFEILCRYCNHQKAGRIDSRNPKTYSVMRKILNEAEYYFLKSVVKCKDETISVTQEKQTTNLSYPTQGLGTL